MTVGWGGPDPVLSVDANDYELGTEYTALADVTITRVRVWAPPSAVAVVARRGRIWSTTGGLLATAVLADTLPSGWSSYDLSAPLGRAAGTRFLVTYSTGGNYGIVAAGLTGSVDSSDSALRALATAAATNGNGVFNPTPGSFPTTTFNAAFYGIDVEYDLGLPGQTAPTVTGVTVTADGLDVVADITATDPEGLVGATYTVDWGDGTTPTVVGVPSAAHTYAAAGLKAILVKVTDSTAKAGYGAGAVELAEPAAGFDATAILDAVVSHALALGLFEQVNQHEPKNAPGHGLTAAVWVQAIAPVPAASGLSMTTGRCELTLRIYTSMLTEPQDAIDPEVLTAVVTLLGVFSGDFDLGGHVREVDLLGEFGQPLSARAGYLTQDSKPFRVMDITVPVIVSDIWGQAS